MKNGRLRREKLTGQFNIAWTDQNLLRKHCRSNILITQDQPNNQEGDENQNSKDEDTHVGYENTRIDHSLDHRPPTSPLSITFRINSKFQKGLRLMLQVRDNNDNILGRQDLITLTSKTNKRINQALQVIIVSRMGKIMIKLLPQQIKRQQKEVEIQHSKVQERQIPRNKNQQQQDDNSNHIRTELN
ncbi:hypothetical protein H5410_003874 [Solanum commersonii]|uniref:Uncharacterized protein n=1 Tax=Solanum commersonii TaxID=4109 RepID=A0A9J6B5V7_SOLCO|nr:hypothetical protein H5410_003874 [Solanum commersonii]